MRKGLVVTLGVVALFIAVPPGFSLAPVISCIPDIIISDTEQNTQTQDRNFFIFSAAVNLDELVRDDDATTLAGLRWSFVETLPGSSILINGIGPLVSPTEATIKDPGANNLRAVSNLATFRNRQWSPVPGTSFGNPGASSMTSTLQVYVSDGTSYTQQAVLVKSVNTAAGAVNPQRDALIPQGQKQWTFASGSDNWTWFDSSPVFPAPTHAATGNGELSMTKSVAHSAILLYGAWESPQNPNIAIKQRWGCILRARFKVRSSVNGHGCPGFRMRAIWTRVVAVGSVWIPNFFSQDFNDMTEAQTDTFDLGVALPFVAGREPGTAGKTYTLLYYPQQTEKLMTTDAVTYISYDMLDMDQFNEDLGSLYVEEVNVDGVDRPNVGAGTPIAALSTTNFSTWVRAVTKIDPIQGTTAGLVATKSASNLTFTVQPGNKWLEAAFSSPLPGTALKAGYYYRVLWTLNSTQTPGGDFAPTIRTSVISTQFQWYQHKVLEGGGSYSAIGSGPPNTPFEQWVCAPTPLPPSTTVTEAMQLRCEVYVLSIPNLVFNKNISGTVRCVGVATEEFPPMP